MPAMKNSTDRNTPDQIRYLPESGSLLPGFPKIYSIITLQMIQKPQQANLLRFLAMAEGDLTAAQVMGEGDPAAVFGVPAGARVIIVSRCLMTAFDRGQERYE